MKKLSKRRWFDLIQERIVGQQMEYIFEAFGEKANCNLGWGVDETDDQITFSTKVYGHGILTSSASYPSLAIKTSFEEFAR